MAHVMGCGLLGFYAHFTPRDGNRLDGVGGPGIDDANTLGMYLATGALAAMCLIMTQKGWRRWVALVALVLIGDGFVLANSRGAFLGLVAGGLAMAWCKAREHRRIFWVMALVGVMGFVVAIDKAFVERMFTISDVTREDEEAEGSARSRMVIYLAQLRMFADHPMGSGYRGTVVLSPRYLERQYLTGGGSDDEAARSSHNTFMTTLVEQGIPGAILFICLLFWLFNSMLRIRRASRAGADPIVVTCATACAAGLVAVMMAGIAADYLMAEVQFWLLAALVAALQLVERKPLPAPADKRVRRPASSLGSIRS
jgi:O-antigen ligase